MAEISRYAVRAQEATKNACLKVRRLRQDQPGSVSICRVKNNFPDKIILIDEIFFFSFVWLCVFAD